MMTNFRVTKMRKSFNTFEPKQEPMSRQSFLNNCNKMGPIYPYLPKLSNAAAPACSEVASPVKKRKKLF